MTEIIQRWSRNGGPARPLPPFDRDSTGRTWTDLAGSEEAREACGWAALADVPAEVNRAQARIALREAGLLDAVDAFVDAHPDPNVKIMWTARPTIRRDSAMLTELAGVFVLSSDDLDDLFRAAGVVP